MLETPEELKVLENLPDGEETKLKLIAGSYKYPVSFLRKGSRYFLSFGFNRTLQADIKMLEGAKWHGFEEPNPVKKWSIPFTQHNRFQLARLVGLNPYAAFDGPLIDFKCRREEAYNHQDEIGAHILTRHYCIVAGEMGCVHGAAIINCNRNGKGFEIALEELYYKFHGGLSRGRSWSDDPTYCRSNKGGIIGLQKIVNVLYKGVKETIKIKTSLGYETTVTPDHEIAVSVDEYIPAGQLRIGSKILTNGKWEDKDGYIRVGGLKGKHPRWTTGGVYEHILVMEKQLGRFLTQEERVHHVNGVRNDNRPDNLKLKENNGEHTKDEHPEIYLNLNSDNVKIVPHADEVVEISVAAPQRVYDIVMEDPYRNFVADGIVVHNCGKTLAAIEAMEASGVKSWFWIAPKSALYSVQIEFEKWRSKITPQFFTYDGLRDIMTKWPENSPPPGGIIFDEASRVKTHSAQRSQAAKHIADMIRDHHKAKGFVVLMSGTPAPKSPVDWWSLCNIACPGFLKEGDPAKFRKNLAVMEEGQSQAGGVYSKLITWLDDDKKCKLCGKYETDASHDVISMCEPGFHTFVPTTNEVARLYKRMKGLVIVKLKKDCLDLPPKQFTVIRCKPSQATLNAAKLITASGISGAKALVLLRELSDGFQYDEKEIGKETCKACSGKKTLLQQEYCGPDELYDEVMEDLYNERSVKSEYFHKVERACPQCSGTGEVTSYTREAVQVECPKEDVFTTILDQHEDVGRLVTYAGFTGSVDRCVQIAIKNQWDFIRVDGRGWMSNLPGGSLALLRTFQEKHSERKRVVFIGQPSAAGMGLNLTASPSIFYYSNDFNAESRAQSQDRIHRPGMDVNRGANIIDCIHLETDKLILDNLTAKRNLELLTLGQFRAALDSSESRLD